MPAAVATAHLVAAAVLIGSGLPVFTLVVALIALLVSLYYVLSPWRYSGRDELVTGLIWYPDRDVLLFCMADGSRLKVEETLSMAAVPGLVAISVITEKRVRPVWLVVTPDQLDSAGWRRLKIMVEWGGFVQREASGQG